MTGKSVDFSQNVGPDDVDTALDSASDEEDIDMAEEGGDAILGGLRKGLRSIRSHAMTELAKCTTEGGREELRNQLEVSTLCLIQAEQKFLETSRIVSGVVDDLVEDFGGKSSDEEGMVMLSGVDVNGNSLSKPTVPRFLGNHNDDKVKPNLPNHHHDITKTQAKMNELFDNRMQSYAETLTKENLLKHPHYVAFQKEITLCEEYFARQRNGDVNLEEGRQEKESAFPAEDLDDDDDVLPSVDPITKKPILNAHRNKFCNHIFDQTSILKFIKENPGGRCPMYRCQNARPICTDHFLPESKLTHKIRAKHENKY